MNKFKHKREILPIWRKVLAFLTTFGLVTTSLGAEPGASDELQNIGFMKAPPAQLKSKFPMCEAFLSVEWIDKEKMVGYTNYEALIKDKFGRVSPKRKTVWALVQMKGLPSFDADVYQYKIRGQLPSLFEKIRKGKVEFGNIKYKGESIQLSEAPARSYDGHHPLLSNNRQTVCIAYPDEQRVWIAEGKSVEQTYAEEQVDQLIRRVNDEAGVPIRREYFKKLWVLDINRDGSPDFIYERAFFYSSPRGIQDHKSKLDVTKDITLLTFPASDKVCSVWPSRATGAITTDGKRYFWSFLREQCDLTEATSNKL